MILLRKFIYFENYEESRKFWSDVRSDPRRRNKFEKIYKFSRYNIELAVNVTFVFLITKNYIVL